jgi:hypothetical protein
MTETFFISHVSEPIPGFEATNAQWFMLIKGDLRSTANTNTEIWLEKLFA